MAVQVHAATALTPPHFEHPVDIDNEMVSLVKAIWARGWQTMATCQDVGEATEGERARGPAAREATGNAGFIEYYRGWAWLKMPRPDALALLNEVSETETLGACVRTRWERGSWRLSTPVIWTEDGFVTAPHVQIYFPRVQIGSLAEVIEQGRAA